MKCPVCNEEVYVYDGYYDPSTGYREVEYSCGHNVSEQAELK
jgi:hypothetical protein